MKKITILILVLGFIVLLYGCGSGSGSGVFVNPQKDAVINQRNVVIDSRGRLPTVTFPSGATFSGADENTLQPGIKVTLTEQEMTTQNFGYFSDSVHSKVFEYTITAYKEASNSAGTKTYVTTIEKPISVTLPSNRETGLCYLGIKENDSDLWRFCRIGAQNTDNIVISRASTDFAPKECTFNLYRLGVSFCLVIYNGNNGNDGNDLPDTVVDSLSASSTVSIKVKDGKYSEDLQIKGVLKGSKLASIKPSDFRARVTYRSNFLNEAPIKVNDSNVIQTTKADKTVPGYSYYHTFLVDNITDFSLVSANGDFNFTLNLKGVDTKIFPSGFLLEFFNKIDSDYILPYSYTEFYTVNQIEQIIEQVELVFNSDESNLADVENNLFVLKNKI